MHELPGVSHRLPALWSRAGGALRRALWIVLGVVVAYELGINAYLLTGGLGRTLSSNPDELAVDYRAAWSLLPGRVHARGLRVRSRDSHIEMQLRMDRCDFTVALLEIPRRTFHVTAVEGDGVALRLRRRLDPDKATKLTLEALPPIDDFERVPLRGPETPPPDDAHYHLFTIEIDRAEARSMRELWIDTVRFTGDARVAGGFFLRPIRRAQVFPAIAEIRSGRITTATSVVASAVSGAVAVDVDAFDPRVTHGAELWGHVSGHATLDVTIPDADFVNRWTGSATATVSGGAGDARIDVQLDHGRLEPPSRVDLHARRLELNTKAGWAEADARLGATIAARNGSSRMEARMEATALRAAGRSAGAAPVRADKATVRVDSERLNLADDPLSDAAVSALVPAAVVADARVVEGWLPDGAPVRIEGGHGTVRGRLDFAAGVARGEAALALEGLRVATAGERFAGSLSVDVTLRGWNLHDGVVDLAGSRVDVRDVATDGAASGGQDWWASAELPASTVTTRRGVSWRARVRASARDAGPLLQLAAARAGLPRWAVGPLSTGPLSASTDLRLAGGAIDVRDAVLTAGPLRIDGSGAKHGDDDHWAALVAAGPLSVGIERQGDRTRLQLSDAQEWFRRATRQPDPAALGAPRAR